MTRIIRDFQPTQLPGRPEQKSALLVNPPVYDTQYWAEWSQPYGLLRISSLLHRLGYKRRELFDFMEAPGEKRVVAKRRIAPRESFVHKDMPEPKAPPYRIEKGGQSLDLWRYHFGKSWVEFDQWLDERGFSASSPPDEIWISATMSYWWESTRDLVGRVRRRWGTRKPLIILGGIYPTIASEHALRWVQPDILVQGEVLAASDLWPDLSLYDTPPQYAVVTPSRGCPFNCGYCAQRAINGDSSVVRYRPPEEIVSEMRFAHDTYGIKDFAFYADCLLWNAENNFQKLLELLLKSDFFYRLYAPEGLDASLLCKSQRLLELMKRARFQKIYLACETIDENRMAQLNRRHTSVEDFVRAVRMCEAAGFDPGHMGVNAFVLYGLPGEKIDDVVKSILFVSDIVGSIIPMLFTPVPSTQLYQQHLPYFRERGWTKDLHMLNGKLYPFLEMNEGSIADYIDLQRLMFTLNTQYRSQSFRPFGETLVAQSFRDNMLNGFHEVLRSYDEVF